jgi:hypothetical protein
MTASIRRVPERGKTSVRGIRGREDREKVERRRWRPETLASPVVVRDKLRVAVASDEGKRGTGRRSLLDIAAGMGSL